MTNEGTEELTADYPHQTTSGKRYRLIEYQGKEMREYESGVIYDTETKKLVAGAKNNRITTENTHEYRILAKQAPIAAAREGLRAGVSAVALADDHNMAWSVIVAAQAELAMSPDMGSSSTKAAEFIGKAADMLPDKGGIKVKQGDSSIEAGSIEELYEIKAWLQAQDDG